MPIKNFCQNLEKDWRTALKSELNKPYIQELNAFLTTEYATHNVYPPADKIFYAINATPLPQVQVVILGQDPYHGLGQANGMSFSVNPGVKFPPSLRNIFKELKSDLDLDPPLFGDLNPWAKQGVLLLNATLTVRDGSPTSHQNRGWEKFTDTIIDVLNQQDRPIIFLLWGKYAQQKADRITNSKHYLLKSAHPSPFAAHRGFFGSKPFSTTNKILEKNNLSPIDWSLT